MILVASSRGDAVSPDINENGLEFFKQLTSLLAQIYLNSYLESKEIECSVSSALATILTHGSFLWSNAVTPLGLSASTITTKDIISNDTLHDSIVLDYSIKHEITDESLTKLTKAKVMYSTDIKTTIQRIDALMTLSELFFGENSYLTRGLDSLVFDCKRNKTLLKRKLYLDEMFIPKLLYSIDDRVNQWLCQCCRENSVADTSLELVSFKDITMKLQLNDFACFLPPNIRKIIKDTVPKKRDTDTTEIERNGKQNKTTLNMVKNEEIENIWKLRDNDIKLTGDDFKKTDDYIKSLRKWTDAQPINVNSDNVRETINRGESPRISDIDFITAIGKRDCHRVTYDNEIPFDDTEQILRLLESRKESAAEFVAKKHETEGETRTDQSTPRELRKMISTK